MNTHTITHARNTSNIQNDVAYRLAAAFTGQFSNEADTARVLIERRVVEAEGLLRDGGEHGAGHEPELRRATGTVGSP